MADTMAPLYDVICNIDVVLGSSSMTVRQCLNLHRDSVIRLTQSAGSDMQIIVNGVPIAQGEVVIIDNTISLRVTDVLPPPSSEASA